MPVSKRRRLAVILLGLILAVGYYCWLLRPSRPAYAVTDIGVLPGGSTSRATAINSRGDVVGSSTPPGSNNAQAFLYQGGKLINLGFLPGGISSAPLAINSQDEITGKADVHNFTHIFLYSSGKIRDLGTLPGFHDSVGAGINDRGEIAVNAMSSPMQSGPPQGQVFLYRHGKMTGIGLPPACSENHALSINNAGQIIGDCHWTARRVGPIGPFLYDSRTKATTVLPVPAPYRRGWASHINDNGQVIGDVSMPDGNSHAVLWRGNHIQDLGTPPGYPISIGSGLNNRGEAVGHCFIGADSVKGFLLMHTGGQNPLRRYLDRDTERAFVYQNGKMQDLNTLIPRDADWILENARDINDRGQIVGYGLHHGQERAFLLTPLPAQ